MLSKELQKYQQHQLHRDMNPAELLVHAILLKTKTIKTCLSENMSVLNDHNILS